MPTVSETSWSTNEEVTVPVKDINLHQVKLQVILKFDIWPTAKTWHLGLEFHFCQRSTRTQKFSTTIYPTGSCLNLCSYLSMCFSHILNRK